MPLSREDVLMLENSMQNLGNTFRQRRLDQERTGQQAVENDLRERMFQSQEKNRVEDNARIGAGTIEAWLQGPDGGAPVHFSGPKTGLDQLIQSAQTAGKPLRVVQKPDPAIKTPFKISSDIGVGTITSEHASLEEAQKALEAYKQAGGKTPQRPGLPAAAIQYINKADELDQQANDTEATDPEGAQALRSSAQLLREHVRKRQPAPVRLGSEKVIDPATGNEKVTYQYDRQPGASAPQPKGKLSVEQAREYLKKAGGDKNKARQMATQDGYVF